MDFYRHITIGSLSKAPITYTLVYCLSILFTFQTLLTAYSSSTYLEQFIAPNLVGWVFALGSFGALWTIIWLPMLLGRIGNVSTTILISLLIIISLVVVGFGFNTYLTITAFAIYLAISPLMYLSIDIFLETLNDGKEAETGRTRGLILTISSAAAFLAPLTMGFLIGDTGILNTVYYVSAGIGLLIIGLLVSFFRHFSDPVYTVVSTADLLRGLKSNVDTRIVLWAQFLMQFFFTWAIIYIPLYLATEINLDWSTISIILASGLLAFVIFEYPVGVLADKYWGEKEMMAIGFVILALSAAAITFTTSTSAWPWMLLMFFSRIGASLVEVTTESYFFKRVTSNEPGLMSLFRISRPLATLIGAGVGSISLLFLPFNFIFFVLAIVMASGVLSVARLTDTK